MKEKLFLLTIVFMLVACGQNKKQSNTLTPETVTLTEHVFKVAGLNDSIVADSIWKMIFTIDGIDQMLLQKEDSVLVLKVNAELIEREKLVEEITNRGGIILR